jgi:peptidoglycan/xylan/chitin deacetylase (PgdA/CDA1 family)
MKPATQRIAAALRPVCIAGDRILPGKRLLVLGWHRVDAHGGGVSTRRDVFERQLEVLEEWNASVLPLATATAMLDTGELPERAVCLTFDDGYASTVDTAWPLLRKRNFAASMYVVTDYLNGDRYFQWDAEGHTDPRARLVDRATVRDVWSDGLTIGSHTASHPWLPHLSDAQIDDELRRSRDVLEDLLSTRIDSLAYPKGGWCTRVWHSAVRAGYTLGVTTDRGRNTRRRERLLLRRSLVPDSVEDFRLMLDGAYDWLRPVDRWRIRKGPVW